MPTTKPIKSDFYKKMSINKKNICCINVSTDKKPWLGIKYALFLPDQRTLVIFRLFYAKNAGLLLVRLENLSQKVYLRIRGEVEAACFFQINLPIFATLPGFFRLLWNNFTPHNGCMDRYGNKFKNRYNPNT